MSAGTVGVILAGIGTLVTVVEARRASKADATRQVALANIAKLNADRAQLAAEREREAGEKEAADIGREAERAQQQARAIAASSGVDVTKGTIITELAYVTEQGKLDALDRVYQAKLKRRALLDTANDYLFQQVVSQASAENARRKGDAMVVASLIGGSGTVAKKWGALTPSDKKFFSWST